MDWPHLEGTYWLCYKESLEMDSPRQTEKGMPKKHLWVMFRLRQRIGAAPGPHSKDYPRTGGGEGGRSLLAYAPGGDKGITTNNCYVRRLQDTGCLCLQHQSASSIIPFYLYWLPIKIDYELIDNRMNFPIYRDRPAAIPIHVKSIDDTSNFDEFPESELDSSTEMFWFLNLQ